MNKRLFKKLENATDKWCQNNYMSYPDKHNHEWNEKFAELIVKDCADFIIKTATIETSLGDLLKEHFGIKNERTN